MNSIEERLEALEKIVFSGDWNKCVAAPPNALSELSAPAKETKKGDE